MIQRGDYVYPYWESAYFFSKPALTLWLMALGMFVVGAESTPAGEALGSLTEWGVRMPFALLAIGAMIAVYRIGSRLAGRATGLLAAVVLASSPQFVFIGKQAITDNPLVCLLTIGLAFFIEAVFDVEEDGPPSPLLRIGTAFGTGVALFSQLALIGANQSVPQTARLLCAAGALAGFLVIGWVFMAGSRRDQKLVMFYVAMALAVIAKGLAVLAVVGPLVILYLLFAIDPNVLRRSRVLVFAPLFLLVASPWYATLLSFNGRDDEGLTFYQRFVVHDNFSRVGAGVHGDRAGLGYFIEQLGYGMFPWSALLPIAIAYALKLRWPEPIPTLTEVPVHQDRDAQRSRLVLFLALWALWSYCFFTISQTKFHHYIFPAVPAFSVLVAYWLTHIAERPSRLDRGVVAVIVVLFAVVARDLFDEPRDLVNLFTYKYDREFPREVQPRPFMGAIVGATGALAILAYALKQRARALLAFVAMGVLFGTWISHHHFNMLSPHWSQAHLFKTYYAEKKGTEPIYAYQLNWRGETFYSRNRVLQVKESGANQRIRSLVDQPGREFIVTEQERYQALKSALSPEKRNKIQIIDRSSNKFYLCVVED
ncbi:MAG: glycosyltransferase family 39 protein [Deltaproteobacteria bacterium]|nr:glycosyltransferase family 39 protein [Deltaproteobacteria bacterium]